MNLTTFDMHRFSGVQSFGADVDDTTIYRYQPGGDLYGSLNSTYGPDAADSMAKAAASGSRATMNSRMAEVRGASQNTGSTSTVGNFFSQIFTDPLKAPVAAALGQGSSGPGLGGANTTTSIVKGVATIAVVALALYALNTAARLKG